MCALLFHTIKYNIIFLIWIAAVVSILDTDSESESESESASDEDNEDVHKHNNNHDDGDISMPDLSMIDNTKEQLI